MRRANVFARKVNSWQIMASGVEPHLADRPQLQSFYEELLGLIDEAKQLDNRQETARGQARNFTRQRLELESRGENVRARTAALLRAIFGFTSEQLVQFGVNPRPRVTRRRKEEPEIGTPEIAAPETTSPPAE